MAKFGQHQRVLPAAHQGWALGLNAGGGNLVVAGVQRAFGGVLVNLAFRQSFLTRGDGDAAYLAFIAFYLVCLAVTWVVYRRPGARLEGV